ncbi:MAG: Mur ligase family protein, partial [Burkholderiaceae bacterium]
AKAMLFEWPSLTHAVINVDDAAGRRLLPQLARRGVRVTGFSAGDVAYECELDVRLAARDIRATREGLAFTLVNDAEAVPVAIPLVGQFNVANLLGVVGVSLACGITFERAVASLPLLMPPAGRMQRVQSAGGPLAIIDYAHTPDALTQAIAALRPLVQQRGGRLWVVFGAGGDRDAGKRAPMGAAAAAADVVIVTSDNPRTEDPQRIVAEVAAGAKAAGELLTIVERAAAIEKAIGAAANADVVLIAGKGHEDYQIVGAEKRPFSDVEHARLALARREAKA